MSDLPDRQVFSLKSVELALDDAAHPWYVENRVAIDAYWSRKHAERPWLYNGTVIMHRNLTFDNGVIRGHSHRVPYAALTYVEAMRPDADAWHLFGSAVILSSDDAMVLIRMAAKTANPGKVCAPAGALDESDIAQGRLDVDASILREGLEETGLDLNQAGAESRLLCWREDKVVSVFRRFRCSETAEDLTNRINAHARTAPDQEIAGAVIVRDSAEASKAVPAYMQALMDWHFGTDPSNALARPAWQVAESG